MLLVLQWLRTLPHSWRRGPEFNPWSGNSTPCATAKTTCGQMNNFLLKKEARARKQRRGFPAVVAWCSGHLALVLSPEERSRPSWSPRAAVFPRRPHGQQRANDALALGVVSALPGQGLARPLWEAVGALGPFHARVSRSLLWICDCSHRVLGGVYRWTRSILLGFKCYRLSEGDRESCPEDDRYLAVSGAR